MNQTDFTQIPLRDLHMPLEVSWWPLAPGWWVLIALILAGAVWRLYRYIKTYRQRIALRALATIRRQLEAGAPAADCLPTVSTVMRRFAMAIAENPRMVAGLVGRAWLDYLDSRWDQDAFQTGSGAALASAPYAPEQSCSKDFALALTDVCIDWVVAQRRSM